MLNVLKLLKEIRTIYISKALALYTSLYFDNDYLKSYCAWFCETEWISLLGIKFRVWENPDLYESIQSDDL